MVKVLNFLKATNGAKAGSHGQNHRAKGAGKGKKQAGKGGGKGGGKHARGSTPITPLKRGNKGGGKSKKLGVLSKFMPGQAKKKGAGKGKRTGGSCKWCQIGECWSHGQIVKPTQGGSAQGKVAKIGKFAGKVANVGKFAGKMQLAKLLQGAKGAKNGGKGKGKGGGKGQWLFVPHGANKSVLKGKGGGKGKHGAVQASSGSAKGDLNSGIALLLERSVTKDDCLYDVTKDDKGKHTATVTISALTTERTEFKGKPASSEKDAILNAAQKALNCLSKEINEARAKRDEVKAEKFQEVKAARKQKFEEKKAAKEASGETAAVKAA